MDVRRRFKRVGKRIGGGRGGGRLSVCRGGGIGLGSCRTEMFVLFSDPLAITGDSIDEIVA